MNKRANRLIFDTSAVNALADDPESGVVLAGLRCAHLVGVTESVIAEIAANSSEIRRIELLGIAERLLKFGMCLLPFHVIVEEQANAYLANHRDYDWRDVNVRFCEAEGEVVRQKIIHQISTETLETQRKWDKEFNELFSGAKQAIQRVFEVRPAMRPSLTELCKQLLGAGGAYREMAINIFERRTGTRLSQENIHDFVDRCPPFKSLLIAICFTQYDRCFRDVRHASLGKAGRVDMFSAVYLPYCGVFVTNDEGQHKAMKSVTEMTGGQTEVLIYGEFRERLFGI